MVVLSGDTVPGMIPFDYFTSSPLPFYDPLRCVEVASTAKGDLSHTNGVDTVLLLPLRRYPWCFFSSCKQFFFDASVKMATE